MNENLSVETTTPDEERIRATITSGLDRLMSISADRVFAEPVRVGDRVVIPAASVDWPAGVMRNWLGAGKRFMVYPVRTNQLIN